MNFAMAKKSTLTVDGMDELDKDIFTDMDEFAPGSVSYFVEKSWRSMMATRALVDEHWGRGYWNG